MTCPCGSTETRGGDDGEFLRCAACSASLETTCALCERAIQPGGANPLCSWCEGVAKAHGQLMADAQRYPDPEHDWVAR